MTASRGSASLAGPRPCRATSAAPTATRCSRRWPIWSWRPSVADDGDRVFRSLADPTRRRILDLLAEHGPLTVSQIAAAFPGLVVSGISKHLMGLRAAGLVTATRQGRQQIYRLNARDMAD